MKKNFAFILIFTICFGCSESNPGWNKEMNATIFFGAEPKNEKFKLTFNKTGNSLSYKYVNQIDSSKTITIRKLIDADTLFFGIDKFLKTDKIPLTNYEFQDLEFEFYDTIDYADDSTGPILFNSKYGLLAINNIYGSTIIFLNERNDSLTEMIIKKLNE
ncbi:hypothetical protein [Tenacibaculum retecalamus]|uniref:hypothetical protein n=1 Tax=Tenacibaculum retecalamus TaxID=3018315 RepID=UPI0023D900FA|nr:hypothetical protein [Tenacibaculum retecalamus]WBX70342.1 hypothetical protein PG912_08630 [Tenacibaculum retecalamus]